VAKDLHAIAHTHPYTDDQSEGSAFASSDQRQLDEDSYSAATEDTGTTDPHGRLVYILLVMSKMFF
jgi:hypothetical protein